MSDLQQTLGVECPSRLVVPGLDGGERALLFTPLTLRIKGEFSEWVKARARAEMFSLRPLLDASTFASVCSDFASTSGSRFAWGKPSCQEAITTDEGVVQFTLLLLRRYQPSMNAEELRPLMEANAELFRLQVMELIGADAKNSETPKPMPATGAA